MLVTFAEQKSLPATSIAETITHAGPSFIAISSWVLDCKAYDQMLSSGLPCFAGGPIHGLIKIATDHRLGIPSQCFAAAKAGIGKPSPHCMPYLVPDAELQLLSAASCMLACRQMHLEMLPVSQVTAIGQEECRSVAVLQVLLTHCNITILQSLPRAMQHLAVVHHYPAQHSCICVELCCGVLQLSEGALRHMQQCLQSIEQ